MINVSRKKYSTTTTKKQQTHHHSEFKFSLYKFIHFTISCSKKASFLFLQQITMMFKLVLAKKKTLYHPTIALLLHSEKRKRERAMREWEEKTYLRTRNYTKILIKRLKFEIFLFLYTLFIHSFFCLHLRKFQR